MNSATLSKVVLVVAGMLLMFLLESLFWPGHGLIWRQSALPKPGGAMAAGSSNAAPWGVLEYTPIALDRPEEYFTNDFTFTVQPVWTFRDRTEEQLRTFFGQLSLTDSTHAWLANKANWMMSSNVVRIAPTPAVVLSLKPDSRKQLYQELARMPENYLQANPFRFRPDGFDDWFSECGLPKDKLELVRSLTYAQDGTLCFADAATFGQVASPEETKCLVRSLWRVSTFVMKLRIDSGTDIEGLMNYWGRLGAARTYKPLLESMSRVPEGTSINVSYFLPAFARLRLFTYPNPRDPYILRQDCFWSSMNFFNSTPDNAYFDPSRTQKALTTDYTQVSDGSRQFGDLLLLVAPGDQALHMCVYIADDVVFTKNGANTQQPWVLMKISEMLGQYERSKPFDLRVYRRTTPPPLGLTGHYSSTARTL